MKSKLKDTMRISISCDRNWKRMTRPRYSDVYYAIHEQIDELGGDLNNALIVALPKGASPRQVFRAITEITCPSEPLPREEPR